MFNKYLAQLMKKLPKFKELNEEEVRRYLSETYISIKFIKENKDDDFGNIDLIRYIQNLANSLESRAIFDANVEDEERRICAFVAAESFALLSDLLEKKQKSIFFLEDDYVFARVEASLLYMVSNFEMNAKSVLAKEISILDGYCLEIEKNIIPNYSSS